LPLSGFAKKWDQRFRIVVEFPPEAAISLFLPGVSSCGLGNGAPFQNDGAASRLAGGESAESTDQNG
jgi:hypothetical protein